MSTYNPKLPNKHVGTDKNITFFVSRTRRPTLSDYRQPETGTLYSLGTVWQVSKNPSTGAEGEIWILSKIVSNQGYWVMVSSGTPPVGPLLTLSDTANTLVFPTASGNIQLEAGSGLTIISDAVNNKLVFALGGGGTAIDSIQVDAATAPGTNPVVSTVAGLVTITGAQIANAGLTNAIRTNSLAANSLTIEIQQAGSDSSSNAIKNGISHYNSTHFSLGANAFVSSQIATTSQIGIVTLASQVQSEYNTYGTTQVVQSGEIAHMFAKPPAIGITTPNTANFTTCAVAAATDTFVILTAAITGTSTSVENTVQRNFYRTTTVGASGLGNTFEFFLYNSAGVDTEFSQIVTVIDVATASSETGHMRLDVKTAGTTAPSCRFYGTRVELLTGSRLRLGVGGCDFMSGTGDPNGVVTAAKGSYYARLDGSSTSTRAYINTDSATAWTAVTTAS